MSRPVVRRFWILIAVAAVTMGALLAQEPAPKHEVDGANSPTARAVEDSKVNEGNDLVYKWIDFAILLAGLGYIGYKFGGPFFRARSSAILNGIEEAAKVRADAEKRAADIEARLQNLSGEIEQIRQHSQAEMRAESDRLKELTAAEIAKVQARAEQEIASAAKLASQELKAYTANLALSLAEQQIRSRMNPQTQQALVDSFVRDLDQNSKAAVN